MPQSDPPPLHIVPLPALQERLKSAPRPPVESEANHRLVLARLTQTEDQPAGMLR